MRRLESIHPLESLLQVPESTSLRDLLLKETEADQVIICFAFPVVTDPGAVPLLPLVIDWCCESIVRCLALLLVQLHSFVRLWTPDFYLVSAVVEDFLSRHLVPPRRLGLIDWVVGRRLLECARHLNLLGDFYFFFYFHLSLLLLVDQHDWVQHLERE